jgi:1,2-phenylacetyl-CoA epoxidase catalytic subunit
MIKAFSLFLCIAALWCSTGCLFSKKSGRSKESSAIAADVEESFRKRWVEKRAAELAGQGTAADAARARAETEFRERYAFTRAGQK